MKLETPRLMIREMTDDDFSNLYSIMSDSDVMYAYDGAFTEAEVRAWLDRQLTRYRDFGFGLNAVILKENGKMIGQSGLTWQKWNDCIVLEIGYIYAKAYWHHGYATEAAVSLKRYAFETLHADAVYSIIRDTNIASQNVAIRNGMTVADKWVKHYRGVDMPHLLYEIRNPNK